MDPFGVQPQQSEEQECGATFRDPDLGWAGQERSHSTKSWSKQEEVGPRARRGWPLRRRTLTHLQQEMRQMVVCELGFGEIE